MTTTTARPARAVGERLQTGRLAASLPLVALFVGFAALYALEGWRQHAPWIFFDEVFYAHDAQSVVGKAQLTLDHSSPFRTLYAIWIAPAWLLDSAGSAYAATKAIGAVTMSATVFPAYAIARTIVPRRLALFAATASCAIPALVYSSTLMEEVLAYPFATVTFWLILRALVERTPGWIAGAVAASLLAPFIRRELVLLPAVLLGAAAVVFAWERWPRWSPRDRGVAAAGGLVGAVVAVGLLWGASSGARTALHHPRHFVDSVAWSAGALTIGLGMLPVIACLAALARPRGEAPRREVRCFSALLGCAVVAFLGYAGGKAASMPALYPLLERNLIYLAPLVFAGTALVLARANVRAVPAVTAAACALAAALTVPVRVHPWPSAEAPTLSVLMAIRSRFGWGMTELRIGLVVAAVVALVALTVLTAVRHRPRERAALVALIAVAVVGWSLTSEIYVHRSAARFSTKLMATVARPSDWVEQATGGEPAGYIGQRTGRESDVWLLAFWNPSLQQYLRLDRPPALRSFAPVRVTSADGTLSADPRLRFLLADQGVEVAGRPVERKGALTLYRVTRPRVRALVVGRYADGWIGQAARYDRFANPERGTLTVTFSRGTWCGPATTPATLQIRVIQLRRGTVPGPTLARATRNLRLCGQRSVTLPTPAGPFRASVAAGATFVPARVQPGSYDFRNLGALVSFSYRSS